MASEVLVRSSEQIDLHNWFDNLRHLAANEVETSLVDIGETLHYVSRGGRRLAFSVSNTTQKGERSRKISIFPRGGEFNRMPGNLREYFKGLGFQKPSEFQVEIFLKKVSKEEPFGFHLVIKPANTIDRGYLSDQLYSLAMVGDGIKRKPELIMRNFGASELLLQRPLGTATRLSVFRDDERYLELLRILEFEAGWIKDVADGRLAALQYVD